MERFDQGHIHPKLEVPGLTCPGREVNPAPTVGGEHCRKELLEQLVNSYEPTTWLPQWMCYLTMHEHTWTALLCRPNSTCKADGLMPSRCLASPRVSNHVTMERLDKGHLHSKLKGPGFTCPSRESNPRRPWEASTLDNSHLNILLLAIRNIYLWACDRIYLHIPAQRTSKLQEKFAILDIQHLSTHEFLYIF